MIIKKGEKLHLMYRALYDGSVRRHIVGEVMEAEGSVCRVDAYVFIYDTKATMFTRKTKRRITIVDLAESGYVVNIIDPEVALDAVEYRYTSEEGVVVTDNNGFNLNINEFGLRN